MKKFLGVCLSAFVSAYVYGEDIQIVNEVEDSNVEAEESHAEFPKLSEPIYNFSGMSVLFCLGYDFNKNRVRPNLEGINKRNYKATTHNISLSGGVGFGGLFRDKYYLGLDLEFFRKSNGNEKSDSGVFIRAHNTLGLIIKSRIGYLQPGWSYMPYVIFGCERFQHQARISSRGVNSNRDTYGSYHPLFGLGVEKKLMNKWSVRGEITYSLGIWDDTNKKLNIGTTSIPYKAKGNRFSARFVISKYL